MNEFTHAITRRPGANFASGLTQADAGPPDFTRALAQHDAYCEALGRCGLAVTTLPADPAFPDGTFVEDVAVLTERTAVATRPGAPSRLGEVRAVVASLGALRPLTHAIEAPGTLDGGDVCQAGAHMFVGISARTNVEGARQYCEILRGAGHTASTIDIRANPMLLHLKSGIAYLGDGRLLVAPGLPVCENLAKFEILRVCAAEAYAANCVRVNDRVLIAAGYPLTAALLRAGGYDCLSLDMSEFRKMDGGLSCLSLRFAT